jgi:hypothetical protein
LICSDVDLNEILARIVAPHFVAGIVLHGDQVAEAAPIVDYMRGWPRDRVRDYCRAKGWTIAIVAPGGQP